MRDETLSLEHFEAFYARGPDPWGFSSSPYEAAKYAATLAALPRARYRKGFEVGCSIGVFTAQIAARCDDLLAVEPVVSALLAAKERNAERPWVRFAAAFIPADWPDERFDLIVLSEVLDYLGEADLLRVAERLERSLQPSADLILVHWVGKKGREAKPTEATEILMAATSGFLQPLLRDRNDHYRLDVLQRLNGI